METSFSEDRTVPIVYVVDDDPEICVSLDSLLRSVGWHVRTFAGTQDFTAKDFEQMPNCVIIDIRLRGESGLMFHQRSRDMLKAPIIFITGFADVEMCRRAMKAGAIDFLVKPFADQELIDAVGAAILVDRTRRDAQDMHRELRDLYRSLTDRQRQVMDFIVDGAQNKDIARRLGLSLITVKMHRASVMRKMNATSLAELVRKATELDMSARSV
ncbi:response regulator transcription factor [Paraburkholderia sp. 2C]